MRKFLKAAPAIAFSLCALYSHGQCETEVKEFYIAYMQNSETDPEANDALKKASMSPGLIAQLERRSQEVGTDAVIHAQDVCQYGIRSLTVDHTKDDWYSVKYKWSPDSEYIIIPVKADVIDGRFTILDILPQ